MNRVYIVSRYLKFDGRHIFHFKGNFKGHYISKLSVDANGHELEVGEEYLIYLKNVTRSGQVLSGTAIKVKRLFSTFGH